MLHSIGARGASCATSCSRRVELLPQAQYEGRPVTPDPAVVAAMAPALERVRALQATPLGVTLDTPLPRSVDAESPLGNLFADALREETGADVAINNNVRGGLRADLAEGAANVRSPVRRVCVRQPAPDGDAERRRSRDGARR